MFEPHCVGGKNKETPLHIAARVKDGEKCALMLLKSGAGPNLTTEDGQTPVHVAASTGNLATLLLLLDDGGDPLFKSKVRQVTVERRPYVRSGRELPPSIEISELCEALQPLDNLWTV